jgi:hypothetical protein
LSNKNSFNWYELEIADVKLVSFGKKIRALYLTFITEILSNIFYEKKDGGFKHVFYSFFC